MPPVTKYATATARGYGKKRSWNTSAEQANVTKKLKKNKTRPAKLCGCVKECLYPLPPRFKDELYRMFVEMEDEDAQNDFLLQLFDAIPKNIELFEEETVNNCKLIKKMHCKYRIPSAWFEDFMTSVDCNFNRDKKSDYGKTSSVTIVGSKEENIELFEELEESRVFFSGHYVSLNICERAFYNLFGLYGKQLKSVKELLINKARQKYAGGMIKEEGNQIEISRAMDFAQDGLPLKIVLIQEDNEILFDQSETDIIDDLNLIDDFFYNQLWKP